MSSNSSRYPCGEGGRSQYGKNARLRTAATNAELWQRLKLGDEQAIADVYDRYSQLVYSVAYQVLRDPGTSEDVLQEIFLQLWRVPDAFDPAKGSLESWLTVVSRRRAIDWLRKRKKEIDITDLVVPVHATQLADAALDQFADKVRRFLEDMPEETRVTFELAYMQGLTHTEISERTGSPLGTTKSRIRQALSLIRRKLDGNRANADGNGHAS